MGCEDSSRAPCRCTGPFGIAAVLVCGVGVLEPSNFVPWFKRWVLRGHRFLSVCKGITPTLGFPGF
jgi:hypothetical protein